MSLSKFAIAVLSVGLAACGGSSSSSSNSGGGTTSPKPIEQGRLIDSPVKGAGFVSSSSISGLTNVNGVFSYRQGDAVSFRLGGLSLGSAQGAAIITLLDLVDGARAAANSGSSTDEVLDDFPAIVNLARLLQSLDVDGDSGNGIQIPSEAAQKVSAYVNSIDFTDPDMFADSDKPAVKFICEVKAARGIPACSESNIVDEDAARSEVKETEEQRRTGNINELPIVSAGADLVVAEAGSVTLQGSAQDNDGNVTGTLWQQTDRNGVAINGSIEINNPGSLTASFTAPEVDQDRIFYFSLTATDNDGDRASDTVAVLVRDSSGGGNARPVANAGVDQNVESGEVVVLDGSNSEDLDGQITSYSWSQIDEDGNSVSSGVALQNGDTAEASFTAPSVDVITQLRFRLTVSDNESATDFDDITINVSPEDTEPENVSPVANAGDDQNSIAGDSVTLDASASSDADGDELSYSWEQTDDTDIQLTGADTKVASFTAPDVSESRTLTFKVTVSDGALSADDHVSVVVAPAPAVCDPADPGTYQQCFAICTDGDPDTACPLPYEDFSPNPEQFEEVFSQLQACADQDPETQCLLPLEGEPEFPSQIEEVLGELCDDASNPQQCLTDGQDAICSAFDPNSETPFCGGGDPGTPPELPVDPTDLLGELCEDTSNPQQCLTDGQDALCGAFDPNSETPFCGGGDPGTPPELPFDPTDLLGELCEDTSNPQQCLTDGQDALCGAFDPNSETPFCGGGDPGTPPELPVDPADLLGELCDDTSNPQQCLTDGQNALCGAFDPNSETPFCGGGDPGTPPELPFDPTDLLGELCDDTSNPQQCLTDGQDALCGAFDPNSETPFCGGGDPGTPPELPVDPTDLLGELCDDASNPQQCLTDGQDAICDAFDPSGMTPFCGDGGDPGTPPELPVDPADLLGELCDDTSNPQQCLTDGQDAICGAFDPNGMTPFCGDGGEPGTPPELPVDPADLLGELCDDTSNPQQCLTDGQDALCGAFDPEGLTPFCGDGGDPGTPPELPVDPADLLGELCDDASNPQQCLTDGQDAICGAFDPEGLTPFCGDGGDPGTPPELPVDPADLLGELCDDASNPQQCLTDGQDALCGAFDPEGLTPFCGDGGDPGTPPELPIDPTDLLGELCDDTSNPQQCLTDGQDALCGAFDPNSATPFCGGSSDPGTPPELPVDPSDLLGELCDDASNPQQCLTDGQDAICSAFDPNSTTPFCGGSSDPGTPPELPVDPADLLGELCDDTSNPQQCLTDGQDALCGAFDPKGLTPFCGGGDPGTPPELPVDPADLLGELCDDTSNPQQCLTDGQDALCGAFDPEGLTPFCGGGDPGTPPELPVDPADLLGELCDDTSNPQQCLTDGQDAICGAFDPNSMTPFCGGSSDPGTPPELPVDPAGLLGELCDDTSNPQQCLTDGQDALCGAFDPNSATPFCGGSSDPGTPPELPVEPADLLGELCDDTSNPQQCLTDGQDAICGAFDPNSATPFCGGSSDPGTPPELPVDPSDLLGELCDDASDPQQCLADGQDAICGVFDPNSATPFCGGSSGIPLLQ
ncbi:PKD domain-containing protein [Spongiibacter marinus]|uniref:PKD domain-containing protein n=1 Tax=Spongiibacter marinus TaxID=354246 RepID=UPI0035BE72BE